MAKYKLLTDLTMNRIPIYKMGDIVDADEQPINKFGDIFAKTKLNERQTQMLNGINTLSFIVESKNPRSIQAERIKEVAPITSTAITPITTLPSTSTPTIINKTTSDMPFVSLEKTGRNLKIGWTIAGWAIFGFLSYKYWNKSNLWKGIILTLGVGNLYNTYKSFSKPSLSIGTGSSEKKGESKGSVSDEKIIDALINSMKQLVISMSASFGQDKDKASADFDRDFAQQKPQVIAKGKQILSTMKDNEKQAVYEIIIFETDLYSKSKTQEDAENIENKLNAKIQELSTKYSVDLKSALNKLKNSKF